MKYIFPLLFFTSFVLAGSSPLELTIADTLANYDIIVDQKTPDGYRLGDTITRAEAVGVALRVADIDLPEKYFCKNYFRDVQYNRENNWICRAIELAADQSIITRSNDLAQPHIPISRIEALAIIMRAGDIPYPRNTDPSNYPKNMPQWEIDILAGALQYHIISSTKNFGPDALATRVDVFGMIYNLRFAGKKMEYLTDTKTPEMDLTSAPEENKDGITIIIPGSESTMATGSIDVFLVTAPREVSVNTPFDMTVKAVDKNGAILTNYSGILYFDLLVGSYSDITLPMTDQGGYAFTSADKGSLTFKNIIIKKTGEYELDAYEIESDKNIMKTIYITAKN